MHALEIAHSLLKRDGLLIDIHPSGQRPQFEVHVKGRVLLAGHVEETDDFVEYFEADNALADMVARGLFVLEETTLFPFLLHAPSIEAIVDFLQEEWSDAILSEAVIERATALLGEPGEGKEIVVREIARISRYRPRGR